jgi:hypothetical protein
MTFKDKGSSSSSSSVVSPFLSQKGKEKKREERGALGQVGYMRIPFSLLPLTLSSII